MFAGCAYDCVHVSLALRKTDSEKSSRRVCWRITRVIGYAVCSNTATRRVGCGGGGGGGGGSVFVATLPYRAVGWIGVVTLLLALVE